MEKIFLLAFILTALFIWPGHNCLANEYIGDQYIGDRIKITTNVIYGADNPPQQTLDVYQQGTWTGRGPAWFKPETGVRPTVIYIHGGGWLGGDKDTRVFFLEPFLRQGWNAVNLNYRQGPQTAPAAVLDVLYAMKWLTQNAAKYSIDPQNIILMGDSAGGHLALMAGIINSSPEERDKDYYTGEQIKIRAIVNLYGISDLKSFDEYGTQKYAGRSSVRTWIGNQDVEAVEQAYSPRYRVSGPMPPVITFHGKKDSTVPFAQSVDLHNELDKKNVRNKLVGFANGTHGGFSHNEWEYMYQEIFRFLAAD